jgi:hypothetical protein
MITGLGQYSKKAARASVLPQISAGMCKEGPVWEAELAGARAYHRGDVAEVTDARILQQRHHYDAAVRYHKAFAALVEHYGVPTDADPSCPKLKGDGDELEYMMGLSSGLLAVVHDIGADLAAEVPLNIPPMVLRAAECIDDDKWWGVPSAMKASVWALQPTAEGAGDPWATFDASWAKGKAAGVRLAGAFAAQSARVVGDDDKLREAIQRFAEERSANEADPMWSMLDNYAAAMVQHESDRLWVAAEGHRTPFGQLGAFPGDGDDEEEMDFDFDDLLGDEGAEEVPAEAPPAAE